MTYSLRKGLSLSTALMFFIPCVASVAADGADGFTPLFNGKDLSGWTGDSKLWRVEKGELVGSTDGTKLEYNSFISTEKTYSDFILKVSVKLRNHNSGVQFRSEMVEGLSHAAAGYQADIAEKTYFGMLYEERKRGFFPYWNAMSQEERDAISKIAKQGEWNHYVITCKGDQIKLELNGVTTCDINDPEGAKEGIIALQLHSGPGMEVRFKDMFIKELK